MYLPDSPKLQSHIQQRHSGPNFSQYYPKTGSKPYIMLESSQVIILAPPAHVGAHIQPNRRVSISIRHHGVHFVIFGENKEWG